MNLQEHIPPLVSVVMCTYNGEKYLQQQIDTICHQTYRNLELLIVDDASTDGSASILRENAEKDARIKLHINSSNIGYNKNFEKAFQLASAEFIAISDQDDIWEPGKIEKMMNNWLPGSLFNFSLSGTFYDEAWEERHPAPNVNYKPVDHLYELVFNSPVHGHASMFKRELLIHCIPFPEKVYYDWWLSMKATSISTLSCLPETLTWHRRHRDNSSRNILSLENRPEREQQLRSQFIEALDTFIDSSPVLKKEDEFLVEYLDHLKKMDGKTFSPGMFHCIMNNRRKIFHYKRSKPLLYFSHRKHAKRMAKSGVL